MIYVQDNGEGIKPEDKSKLFKLFGKLKSEEGVNNQGIGLGLNICKQICELYEGMIDVDSERGVGSKFFFKMKVDKIEEYPELEEISPNVNSRCLAKTPMSSCEVSCTEGDIEIGDIQPMFSDCILQTDEIDFTINSRKTLLNLPIFADILITDDSALNLLAIRSQLSSIAPSSSCDQALDGNEAIELFKERLKVCLESNWLIKPYRIILMDYNMPHCDGPTAIRKIREICEEVKNDDV